MFLVRVRVEGGVTGARESTLKMHGGETMLFKTAREAEQQAAEYMRRLTNPCGSAQYTAWVEEEVKQAIYRAFQSNNICEREVI